MDKISQMQGIDIRKMLTKKGREEQVYGDAVHILISEGYKAELVETKKGFEIKTDAPDEVKKKAIEEAKEILKMVLKNTQKMLKRKIGL